MKLRDLQKAFMGHIYNDHNATSELSQELNSGCPVGTDNGLRVYKDNLLHGIISYMEDVFPLTKKALGDENFKFFVKELLYSSPSSHNDIRAYGSKFREFLRKREELKDSEWAEGLVGYEWLSYEILYKDQPEPINEGELKNYENEKLIDLRVECIPSLYLYHSPWPIVKMVNMLRDDTQQQIEPMESFTALYASEGSLKCEELHPNLWHVLRDYKDGRSLDYISKKPYSDRSVQTAWEMLTHCVKSGYIKAIHATEKLKISENN